MIKEYFCKSLGITLGITLGIITGCSIVLTINDYLNGTVQKDKVVEETKDEDVN